MNDILLEISRQEDNISDEIKRRQHWDDVVTRGKKLRHLSDAKELLRQAKMLVMRAAIQWDDYEKTK